jgi:hypothetical protein
MAEHVAEHDRAGVVALQPRDIVVIFEDGGGDQTAERLVRGESELQCLDQRVERELALALVVERS